MRSKNIKAFVLVSSDDEIKELESNLINFNVLPDDVKKFTVNRALDLILNLTKEENVIEIVDNEI